MRDSLLQLFIQEVDCKDCYYEMYVDKYSPGETQILLRTCNDYSVRKSDSEKVKAYLEKRIPSMYDVYYHK